MTLTELKALYTARQFEAYQAICEAAWSLVKPEPHWKLPVAASVAKSHMAAVGVTAEVVAHAVEHFTATPCTYTEVEGSFEFKAAGYWAGPAC